MSEAKRSHGSRFTSGRPLGRLSLANFLYEDAAKTGPLLEIPVKFTDDD